jgi:DNA-binding HxlR family transcriptional regulator
MVTNNLPQWNEHDENCPTRIALDSICAKWTVLVILQLAGGSKRFGVLKRGIIGVSQKALTDTLKDLEKNGAVKRTVHPTNPPQVEYSLTPSGETLLTLVNWVKEWADTSIDKTKKAQVTHITPKSDLKVKTRK